MERERDKRYEFNFQLIEFEVSIRCSSTIVEEVVRFISAFSELVLGFGLGTYKF